MVSSPHTPQQPLSDATSRSALSLYEREIDQWKDLVWYVVNKIRPRLPNCVSEDELFSAGMVGLMTAARSYDASRGAEFKTYAYHRIRGAILDELRRLDFLPRSQRERARRDGYEAPAVVAIPTDENGQESLVADEFEAAFENEDLLAVLHEALDRLPGKMSVVMTLYYREGLRMREIGDRLNLTESRVSQIHSNAISRLRRTLRSAAGL